MNAWQDEAFMSARQMIQAYEGLLGLVEDIPGYTTLGADYDIEDGEVAIPDHVARGAVAYEARRAGTQARTALDRWLDRCGDPADLAAVRQAIAEGLRRLSQLGAADDGIYDFRRFARDGAIQDWLDERARGN